MKYENIQNYPDEQFRRITGVKRATFEKMLTILRPAKIELTSKGGPKPKLCLEDMLLATLEYFENTELVRMWQRVMGFVRAASIAL